MASGATVVVTELARLTAPRATPVPLPAPTASRAAQLGRAVHRVLQWSTADSALPQWDELATAAALEFDLPPSTIDTVSSYARTIRESATLQRFFDPAQVSWSADEFDVVSDGELLRIDRLVRLGDKHPEWWVLDYKLAFDAAADDTLRRQLARYRDVVQALAGAAPVHAAFITGDGALQELADGSGSRK